MERKKRSKSKTKSVNKENADKFHGLKYKLKQTFYPQSLRSLSIPRSSSSSHSKDLSSNEINRSRHKSNTSSPNLKDDRASSKHNWFNQMTKSNISNGSHEFIELNSINNSINNIHYFINQTTDNKITYCDVCNDEIIPMGSVIACKFCLMVIHEQCCNKVNLSCQNNRLSVVSNIDFDDFKLNHEVEVSLRITKFDIKTRMRPTGHVFDLDVLKANSSFDSSEVKLRRKTVDSASSPLDSDYYTCKTHFANIEKRGSYNFYLGGIEPTNCRDSLVSVTSITSILSMASQVSYDFTTLDHDSIKIYGIQVKPINQRATALIENSLTDISRSDSQNSDSSYIQSDINSNECICKPSFTYQESTQEIVKIEWKIEELEKKSELFNKNNFGLTSELKQRDGEHFLLGTVRVYINLLRPIQMEFSSRPSSIFDVINYKDSQDSLDANIKVETFWLPRGTSKRLYVNHSTTTTEVINGLLKKFHIKANPKKFGLYEHTIEGERRVSVRKLMDIECPLGTLLMWTEGQDKINETMLVKRLVLQENETGDIEWTGFSKPELNNFLLILDREEQENLNKIKLKYSILKNEILRLEKLL